MPTAVSGPKFGAWLKIETSKEMTLYPAGSALNQVQPANSRNRYHEIGDLMAKSDELKTLLAQIDDHKARDMMITMNVASGTPTAVIRTHYDNDNQALAAEPGEGLFEFAKRTLQTAGEMAKKLLTPQERHALRSTLLNQTLTDFATALDTGSLENLGKLDLWKDCPDLAFRVKAGGREYAVQNEANEPETYELRFTHDNRRYQVTLKPQQIHVQETQQSSHEHRSYNPLDAGKQDTSLETVAKLITLRDLGEKVRKGLKQHPQLFPKLDRRG